ncbi:hypothetical protein QTP88_011323 [Uroleucon formosanum]
MSKGLKYSSNLCPLLWGSPSIIQRLSQIQTAPERTIFNQKQQANRNPRLLLNFNQNQHHSRKYFPPLCQPQWSTSQSTTIQNLPNTHSSHPKKNQNPTEPCTPSGLNSISKIYKINSERYENNITKLQSTNGSLWRKTKNIIKLKELIPPIKLPNNKLAISDLEKSNTFAEYFYEVFKPNNINPPINQNKINQSLNSALHTTTPPKHFTPNEIKYTISKLKNGKAPGHDSITNNILKKLTNKAILNITHIFNAMLRLSYFPPLWKISTIILVHKPGKPKNTTSSYRPIGLLPSLGATDGLGKAYARQLAGRGLDVVLVSRLRRPGYVRGVRPRGQGADGLEVGVLVNNVGLSYPHPEYFLKAAEDRSGDADGGKAASSAGWGPQLFDDMIRCNITSMVNMCRLVMPGMADRKRRVPHPVPTVDDVKGIELAESISKSMMARTAMNNMPGIRSRALRRQAKEQQQRKEAQAAAAARTVFDIVVGTPKSEKMLGDNSNAGTTLSTDTTISTYSIGFDKTVEHVTRMVPEFSGGIDEKLIFFINACELVAEITPVANRDIMLRTILTRIRGQAYEVIRYEEITSWEMLKTLLKNTYDKPINAAYLQIELFSAKQRYKESLIEYATRIRNLVQAVSEGSTQGKSTSDALAVKTNIREQALLVFLEGINDKIKVMVKSKNPSTLEQAIQMAIIEDKNITHLMKCRELASITMCPETQPLRIGSAGLPCEVELFMKPTVVSATCAVKYLELTRSIYHKLKYHNKWIYIINTLDDVAVTCDQSDNAKNIQLRA